MITHDILDHIGDAIYGLDRGWRFTFFNRAAEQFFGRDRNEVIGRTVWDCFPAAKDAELGAALRRTMKSRETLHVDLLSPSTGKWADIRMFPLEEGGLGVSWRDITDAKKRESALLDAAENQDMLFRELAHRVTNNFQEAASRVALQGREVQDPTAREMCEKMATSIRSMGLVHRRLYRSRRYIDQQDLGDYVQALCEDLSASLPKNISLKARTEPGTNVDVGVATTVGMMVAELVMNSRKHAWPADQPGQMVVSMRRDGCMVEVELWDDGQGVPEGLDLNKSAGLGLKLLGSQIKRLGGAFTHRNVEGGAIFTLRFLAPNLEADTVKDLADAAEEDVA